jgi:hypothetical protein
MKRQVMIVDIKETYYEEEQSDDLWATKMSLEGQIALRRRLELVFEDFLEIPSIRVLS